MAIDNKCQFCHCVFSLNWLLPLFASGVISHRHVCVYWQANPGNGDEETRTAGQVQRYSQQQVGNAR